MKKVGVYHFYLWPMLLVHGVSLMLCKKQMYRLRLCLGWRLLHFEETLYYIGPPVPPPPPSMMGGFNAAFAKLVWPVFSEGYGCVSSDSWPEQLFRFQSKLWGFDSVLLDALLRWRWAIASDSVSLMLLSEFYFFAAWCSALAWHLLWRRGCLCVSVTLMYCAQTTESIIMRPLPDFSPAILVFPYQI